MPINVALFPIICYCIRGCWAGSFCLWSPPLDRKEGRADSADARETETLRGEVWKSRSVPIADRREDVDF